ncbi:MAG: hypothetical protein AB1679_12210 [Actinomycetota bacterium]
MNAEDFRRLVEAAKADVEVFARELLREPLWPHQVELVRCPARFVCACSGRRAGKSRAVATKAIHSCLTTPGFKVLIVSAGDDAARELLQTCSDLVSIPIVEELVDDVTTHVIRFKNGSTIRSVPASQKQVRGHGADLLIVDEAAFVDEDVLSAAKWVITANPGSQLLMTSTPYGRLDRWFATLYRAGLKPGNDLGVASFHWPSTVSPLVDEEVLRVFRATSTDREYRQEVLAEWVEDAGSLFPAELLESATADLPEEALALPVAVAGVDWGRSYDSCALVGVSRLPTPDGRYAVTLAEERQCKPHLFLPVVLELCRSRTIRTVIPEENGVGGTPADQLAERVADLRLPTTCQLLTTTQQTKVVGFGFLERLMRDGLLVVDRRFTQLLRQLGNLEVTSTDAGDKISVPENRGHDDLAMALSFCGWFLAGRNHRGVEVRAGSGRGVRPPPAPPVVAPRADSPDGPALLEERAAPDARVRPPRLRSAPDGRGRGRRPRGQPRSHPLLLALAALTPRKNPGPQPGVSRCAALHSRC